MGFGIRLAPGVRVGVSSRGVRTSLGPRIATVHMGGGGLGFSTGMGPVSYGTSLTSGGSGRRYSGGGGGTRGGSYSSYYGGYGTSGRTDYEKAVEAEEIIATIKRWTEAHKTGFPTVVQPEAPLGPVTSESSLYSVYVKEELAGISIFKRALRAEAKARATSRSQEERARLLAEAKAAQAKQQAELDIEWNKLVGNDPDTLMTVVTEAFGDNDAKASIVQVVGSKMDLLMLAPGTDVLPERMAGVSPTGKLSVKKMTAAQRNEIYYDIIPSQIVATVKEAFSVAPGIDEVNIVAVRLGPKGIKGLECIGFGTILRTDLVAMGKAATASEALYGHTKYFLANFDAKLAVQPLDLSDHPEVKAFLEQIHSSVQADEIHDNDVVSALAADQTDRDLEQLVEATKLVVTSQVGRVDWLQHRMSLDHRRAAEIISKLKQVGVVGLAGVRDNYDVMNSVSEVDEAVDLVRMVYGPLNPEG